MNASFWGLLEEVTHDAFMASTYFLTLLTLALLGVALWRLVPQRLAERSIELVEATRARPVVAGRRTTARESQPLAHRRPTWQEALSFFLRRQK